MKKLRTLLLFGAALPFMLFGQTLIYDFDTNPITYPTSYAIGQSGSDPLAYAPAGTNTVGTNGTAIVTNQTGVSNPADITNMLSLYNANTDKGYVLDLTSVPQTSAEYSITWTQYIRSTTWDRNIGVVFGGGTSATSGTGYLQTIQGIANVTIGNYAGVRAGYSVWVKITGAALTFYAYKITVNGTSATFNQLSTATVTVTNSANVGRLFRASAKGTTLKMEYSTNNGTSWSTGLTYSNPSNSFTAGVTQLAYGWGTAGAGGSVYSYLDNIYYKDEREPSVTMIGNDNYVYNATPQGPATSSYMNFTNGDPTRTYTYSGIGTTTYASSTTAPTDLGTYKVTVNATNGNQSASSEIAFQILPPTFDVLYTFKQDAAGSTPQGVEYPQGSTSGIGVMASYSGTDLSTNTTVSAYNPTAGGSVNGTGVANLTSIPSSSNYSLTWKEYITANGYKKGFLLQGQTGTCAYANDMKQGYLFIVNNDPTNGTLLRIYKTDASGVGYPVQNANSTITNPAVGAARWYRASVAFGVQKFEYSDDGSTWTTGIAWNDESYAGLAGTTQAVHGLQAGVGGYYYDYIASSGYAAIFNKIGVSNWSTAIEWTKSPTSTNDLIIESGELVVDQSETVNAVLVKPGAKLTINNGQTLTSKLKLLGDANSTGTFVNKGGTLTVGSATMQQYITAGRNWYVSSPVSNATSAVFSAANSATNKLYVFDETTNAWPQITDNTTALTAAKGYVANMPASGVITYSGALNDGNKSIGLTRSAGTYAGFNLVGNPYPSYLDWQAVSTANPSVSTSIWYRTKTLADAYTFDTYNASGNLATGNGVKTVTKLIPPMQAFWVYVTAPTTLAFTNTMRFHEDVSGNRLKSGQSDNQNVIRLKVANGENSDEAIVFDNQNAQNSMDAFDSPKMPSSAGVVPQVYTFVEGKQVAINGLASLSNLEIPVGFNTGVSGSFRFGLNATSVLDADTRIYLKDKLTSVEFDLTDGAVYTFNSEAISSDNRFSLLLKAATSVRTPSITACAVYKESGKLILVNAAKLESDASVSVYNAMGQLLCIQKLSDRETTLDLPATNGVLILKVRNAGTTSVLKTTIQ